MSEKLYTKEEVAEVIRHFVETADCVTFTKEVGVTGWDEVEEWITDKIINKKPTVNDKYRE